MTDIVKVRLTAEGIQDVVKALRAVRTEAKATSEAGDALGNLGVIFAAKQLAGFAKGAVDAAGAVWDMSQKTGVATEQLSVFLHMGRQAGVDTGAMEQGFVRLSKTLAGLQRGEAAAANAFESIGLSAEELKGLSLDQVMVKIANAIAKYQDGAGKTAVATEIFGKAGANLIPLLNDLAEGGFDRNREKLEKLGAVLSTEAAKAADEFGDALEDLKTSATATAAQIGSVFLPALTKTATVLANAVAETPTSAKVAITAFMGIGTAATATAVAVKALGSAFAGLGPIGLAVVAISAVTAGLIAYNAAQEEAQRLAVQGNRDLVNRVNRTEALVAQYSKETDALKNAGLSAKERKTHEEKLKEIKDDLIKISPDYREILEKEKDGIRGVREELEKKLIAEKQELENKRKKLQAEYQEAEAYRQRVEAEAARPAQVQYGSASAQDIQANEIMTLNMRLDTARKKAGLLKAQLDALSSPATPAPGGEEKPVVPILPKDPDALAKAQGADILARSKRMEAQVKQEVDSFNALTESLYKQGLISLETYLAARRNALEKGITDELAALKDQLAVEQENLARAKGEPERMAARTKIADIQAAILRKAEDGEQKLQALERLGTEKREAAALEALKLEAELEAAKGRTGEAAIRAIQAEYEERIRVARSPEAKAALQELQAQAVAKSDLSGKTQAADLGKARMDTALQAIDNNLAVGALSDAAAQEQRIQVYQRFLPLLRELAEAQLAAAQTTNDPALIQQAEAQLVNLQGQEAQLVRMKDTLADFKEAAADAFVDGFANFLATLADNTSSLTDKVKALGASIAQAVAQLAAMQLAKAAAGFFGMPVSGHAAGGLIVGPGTGTSDSIPAWLSNGEFVMRNAARAYYGADFMAALNGLRVPKEAIRGFADGGLVNLPEPRALPVRGEFTHRVDLGLDEGLFLRALETPEGARVFTRMASSNRNRFNRALGRG